MNAIFAVFEGIIHIELLSSSMAALPLFLASLRSFHGYPFELCVMVFVFFSVFSFMGLSLFGVLFAFGAFGHLGFPLLFPSRKGGGWLMGGWVDLFHKRDREVKNSLGMFFFFSFSFGLLI